MEEQEQYTTRPRINLEMLGFRLGDILSLIDDPATTCQIVELYPPRVLHDGEVKSLTAASNDAYEYAHNDPSSVWVYRDETLSARRERFEEYHRSWG